MRRKPGTLLPIEIDILSAGLELQMGGADQFHGFALAKMIATHQGARNLTAHGTLYRALDRLAAGGLVEAEWEDPQIAADEARPRRRLYRITPDGQRALVRATGEASMVTPRRLAGEGA